MRIPFHLKVGEIGHSIQWPLSPLWLSNYRYEIKLSVLLDVILYSLPSSHRSVHMLSHTKRRCVPSLSKCAILLNSLSSYAMLAHARWYHAFVGSQGFSTKFGPRCRRSCLTGWIGPAVPVFGCCWCCLTLGGWWSLIAGVVGVRELVGGCLRFKIKLSGDTHWFTCLYLVFVKWLGLLSIYISQAPTVASTTSVILARDTIPKRTFSIRVTTQPITFAA